MRTAIRGFGLGLLTLILSGAALSAAEIKVLCVGAIGKGMQAIAADFTKETGDKVTVILTNPAGVNAAIDAGKPIESLASDQPVDVVVVAHPSMEMLDKKGVFKPGTRKAAVRAGIGVAVKEGAAKPDISTPEKFKQAVLAAKSVVYGDPTQANGSGIVVEAVMRKAGIWDAVKAKGAVDGLGQAKERIAKGEIEMGLFNLAEAGAPGVSVVGPVPDSLQSYTDYDAAVPVKAASPELGQKFITFLANARDSWHKVGNEVAAK